jgi:hypothetical protein
MTKSHLFAGIATAVALLYLFNRPSPVMAPDARAKAMCRGAVNAKLKNPTSAEYGTASALPSHAGGWIVRRTVTATNSFGTMVRSEFICEISPNFVGVKVLGP